MSSELLVDLGEDPATTQLGPLTLATIEDQQWPADEAALSSSGEAFVSKTLTQCMSLFLFVFLFHVFM